MEQCPQAHLAGENDALAQVSPLLELVSDWRNFLKLLPSDDIDLILPPLTYRSTFRQGRIY